MYPLVAELAADGVPVAVSCRVLKLARQPYYRWLADPITPSEVVEAYRANALFDAHCDDPEFGHRLLADEARDAGEEMSDRTAWRIASANGWWSAFGKKPGPPVNDDLCAVVDEHGRTRHVFAADRVNQLWLVNITEHRTAEGKLYCCAIKDAFSGLIVGYSIDSRMKSRLAVQALENAVQMRGDVAGCIVHSDSREAPDPYKKQGVSMATATSACKEGYSHCGHIVVNSSPLQEYSPMFQGNLSSTVNC